ncbi:hypothetical protein C8R43DRAFT_942794 [Mycena crocata]|nr:hypothetical protein C8R43DRAFT_942794 [Mycena crocata]
MHHSLHIRNLSRLPSSVQQVTRLALKGSLPSLRALCVALESFAYPDDVAILFLPVFYANLDPLLVPSLEADRDSVRSVGNAPIQALRGLSALRRLVSVTAFGDVWPRYWAWAQFFQQYEYPHEHSGGEPVLQNLLALTAFFARGQDYIDVMRGTTGLHYSIARVWRWFVTGGHTVARIYIFNCVARCLFWPSLCAQDPGSLEEFIDGAGGTRGDLAQLVVASLNHPLPTERDGDGYMAAEDVLNSLLNFVVLTDEPYYDGSPVEGDPITTAFVLHGLTQTLPGVLSRLADRPGDGAESAVQLAFAVLRASLRRRDWSRWLVAALDSGLLPAMLACGFRPSQSCAHRHLQYLCVTVLPVSLMYVSVVDAFQRAVEPVVGSRSPLARDPAFVAITALAAERLLISRSIASAEFQPRTACDNIEVRASSPFVVEYSPGDSSGAAPPAAMRTTVVRHVSALTGGPVNTGGFAVGGGNSRSVCDLSLLAVVDSCSVTPADSFTRRQRVFLRAVLRSDYIQSIPSLFRSQACLLSVMGDVDTPVCTVFDYTLGSPRITVVRARDDMLLQRWGDEWAHAISRTQRSGGRLQLHVFILEAGRCWMLTLRPATAHLSDALQRLVATVPTDAIYRSAGEWIAAFAGALDAVY